jgi:Tfp pilus assembly protein FimV
MVTIPYWVIRYAFPAGFLLLATVAILLARQGLHDDHAAAAQPRRGAPAPARTAPQRQSVSRPSTSTYSVRRGDTLGTIAEQFETTVDQLLALNPGIDPRSLRVGETLRVSR